MKFLETFEPIKTDVMFVISLGDDVMFVISLGEIHGNF